ncbi:Serine carboxypeptidase-like 6 [Triticum urartu]|uniref:Serine carboxypeptidase-like 6 n=1 Tax=Triticum urartu TaxID=4572 RepID=M7YRI3_TRIUA|nr:Serine carboxypeptidase-like 6 [Triticum urartu]
MSLKLLRVRTAGQCHFLSLLLLHLVPVLLLLPPSRPASAAALTVVTHLPGFDGPLPFNLETGYVGVDEETGAELFYYFVESERSPGTDPLLLWLTGGPRCSVIMGLAFEIGPLKFVLAPYSGGLPELIYNPYSWTKFYGLLTIILDQMANILLLDSPWFTDHPQYLSNPFYIGGDSYAGKDKVTFYVVASNSNMDKGERADIMSCHMNRGGSFGISPRVEEGYMVGNPITDPKFDENYKIPSSHGFGIISDQIYESAVKNCKGDYVNPVNEMCVEVLHTINNGTTSDWIQCNIGPPYTYEIPSSIPYHLNLTTRGYRALVYRFAIEYINNMTFATVKGAGHTAPEYRPKECFAMAQRVCVLLRKMRRRRLPQVGIRFSPPSLRYDGALVLLGLNTTTSQLSITISCQLVVKFMIKVESQETRVHYILKWSMIRPKFILTSI